jgi:L-erythrulose 1-phosphate isomerase
MKKLYFGSNLKMYKGIQQTEDYLKELVKLTSDISRDEIELFIIPSYTSLERVGKTIDQKYVKLGAQNMCWEEQGQFTGEISPLMLEEVGIKLVMIGHSERRHVFRETDEDESKKVRCQIIPHTHMRRLDTLSLQKLLCHIKVQIVTCIASIYKQNAFSLIY